MFSIFMQHRNYMLGILALSSASIICQIAIGVIYRRLIRETEHMSATSDKSLQQLKLKFSGCRKINEKVANVPVFVDKYLSGIKLGRVPLSFIRHLSGQLMLLAVLTAGVGACRGIIGNENFFSVAPFYIVSFLGLYLYFAVSSLIDVPGKQNTLRINLVDYLENHLSNRLEQTESDIQSIASPSRPDDSPRPAPVRDPKSAPSLSEPELEELKLLLQELLT